MANWGWSTGATGYDDEDRLVSWDRDDTNLSQDWTLTNEGDWSQFVENTTTQNRTHGPAHELNSVTVGASQYNLSHDAKGNITLIPSGLRPTASSLSWDFDNRMSAADTDGDNIDDVTLKYDAQGRRIAKISGTTTTVYVLSGWQVVAEYSSGAAPTSPTEKYVYASYIDEPVLKDGTGGTVYYHRNTQFSVSALTNTSGAVVERYAYEPYGELTILAADGSTVRASSSYGNSYTYTGRRWDSELRLYYFRARYYDPGLGRSITRNLAPSASGRSRNASSTADGGTEQENPCGDGWTLEDDTRDYTGRRLVFAKISPILHGGFFLYETVTFGLSLESYYKQVLTSSFPCCVEPHISVGVATTRSASITRGIQDSFGVKTALEGIGYSVQVTNSLQFQVSVSNQFVGQAVGDFPKRHDREQKIIVYREDGDLTFRVVRTGQFWGSANTSIISRVIWNTTITYNNFAFVVCTRPCKSTHECRCADAPKPVDLWKEHYDWLEEQQRRKKLGRG